MFRIASTFRRIPVSGNAGSLKRRFLSKTSKVDPSIQAVLSELHIDERLHKGIVNALKPLYGNEIEASQIQAFGEDGLRSLAEALEKELDLGGPSRPSRKVHFTIPHHNTEFDLDWKVGDSLLRVVQSQQGAELLSEYIEASCSGNASCCSCHVYVSESMLNAFPEPSEAELDMLDLAYEPRETSRLSCQVVLTQEILEADVDLKVEVPAGVYNLWS